MLNLWHKRPGREQRVNLICSIPQDLSSFFSLFSSLQSAILETQAKPRGKVMLPEVDHWLERTRDQIHIENPFGFLLEKGWYTAQTTKGMSAQFVHGVSLVDPGLAMEKYVFPADNVRGIERRALDGLTRGFSIGLSTCPANPFAKEGGMEAAPYWVGLRDEKDLRVALEGDKGWGHWGDRFQTADERKGRPWIERGLVRTARTYLNLAEVVVNFHPPEYGQDKARHYVARVCFNHKGVSGEMRLDTYNLRGLGGGLDARDRILFEFPYDSEVLSRQRCGSIKWIETRGKIPKRAELPPLPSSGKVAYGQGYLVPRYEDMIDGMVVYTQRLSNLVESLPRGPLDSGGLEAMEDLRARSFLAEEIVEGILFVSEAGVMALTVAESAVQDSEGGLVRDILSGSSPSHISRKTLELLERARGEGGLREEARSLYQALINPQARRTVEGFLSFVLIGKGERIFQIGQVLELLPQFEPILEFIATDDIPLLYEVREIPRSARRLSLDRHGG